MNQLNSLIFYSIAILLLSACSDPEYSNYGELGWEDLRPYEERREDQKTYYGSLEIVDDWYSSGYAAGGVSAIHSSAVPRQAISSGIVAEVDGTNARIPGFVVPVEFDEENAVTEFFLVPYFGACFHMPPPPPNQTIYVTSAVPIKYESIYDPVWIMGVMKTQQTGNDIATAAYSLELHRIAPYEE